MNFDEAIKAHCAWKIKLSIYLKKPDGTLKYADVKQDNKCILGEWIYGEGKNYAHLPEFQILKEMHSKFHKEAAEVINKADSGLETKEITAIGSSSNFANASSAVVGAIMAMEKKSKLAA